MIVTTALAEIPLPEALTPNGERNWTYAELDPPDQHFLVTLNTTIDEDLILPRTFLVSTCNILLGSLPGLTAQGELVAVQFISPSSLNGTGHYRLDHIREIWGDKHSWAWRYVLADGSELIDGEVSSPGWECLLML